MRRPRDAAASLYARFLTVRQQTERLAAPLSPEDAQISVTGDTSPPKWHLAHTTWFFERMVLQRFSSYAPFREEFDFLFNSYYETAGRFLPKKQRPHMSRPGLEEIRAYRAHVDEALGRFLRESPSAAAAEPVIELGLQHEQQHQELLLMDVKRNFYASPLRPAYQSLPAPPPRLPHPRGFVDFAGGRTEVGFAGEGFAYDNERGRHTVWLEPFQLAADPVLNGEYLEFVEGGGYRDPRFWLADGWDTVRREGWEHPLYWEKGTHGWSEMTLAGMRPLNLAEPVSHVSYYEAQAFARWKGARLPTEFEWEHAARSAPVDDGHFLEDGDHHPRPATTAGAFSGLHGGLWEWTGSAYLPYPRYRAYDEELAEYNGKFMCNQMVLRGGSFGTPRSHYRPSYRNFYYPQMRWQFCGFRLARDL